MITAGITISSVGKIASAASSITKSIEKTPYIGPILVKYWYIIAGMIISIIVIAWALHARSARIERRKNSWIRGVDMNREDLIGSAQKMLPARCPECFRNFNVLTSNLPGEVYCPFCGHMSFIRNPIVKDTVVTIRCPECGETNDVTVASRPTTTECPACRAAGIIR